MSRSRDLGRFIAIATFVTASLAACGGGGEAPKEEGRGAATVAPIAGSKLRQVTVTADAAKRIDLRTSTVTPAVGGTSTQIPYSAVLYDPDGHTWTFVKTKTLTFVRKPIEVEVIVGDTATLTSGPPVGTQVVTLGATELYGAEIGVGDE